MRNVLNFITSIIPPIALAACVENVIPTEDPPVLQCEGADYTAFDVENHAQQDVRVAGFTQMKTLLEAAVETPAAAATKFEAAAAIYADAGAMSATVQGRTDDHLDNAPLVGDGIDARIDAALSAGAAATTALEAELATESIDKAMTEFFFLSVFHGLVQGQAASWDEAFGDYGAAVDNDLDGVQSIAAVAKRRDDDNGTAFEASIFQSLAEGSCVLATRLAELDTDAIDARNDPELSTIIDDIDTAMRQVLALSAGHEATEIGELQAELLATPGDVDLQGSARVKLVELDGFFRPLERLLRAEGDSVTADALRTPLAIALADTTAAWIDTFDSAAIIATLEAKFVVDVVR